MIRPVPTGKARPGRIAPASFLFALLAVTSPAQAQQPQPPAAAPQPGIDELTALKLVWSTMAAVDQANKTGNYSVLRDLGSRGFQGANNAASLGGNFAVFRNRRIDLSNTLLVPPAYEIPPTVIQPGVLRMRGRFNMRPVPIGFDLLYQWEQGWRLFGISLVPLDAVQQPQQRAPAQRR